MNRKQADRRPDEKPAEQGSGKYDPSKPEYGRRIPEVAEDKGSRKPDGTRIGREFPRPDARGEGKDILQGERSDRQSGRPLQLEDDDEQVFPGQQPSRADSERRLGGRPQEGGQGHRPREAKPTKR